MLEFPGLDYTGHRKDELVVAIAKILNLFYSGEEKNGPFLRKGYIASIKGQTPLIRRLAMKRSPAIPRVFCAFMREAFCRKDHQSGFSFGLSNEKSIFRSYSAFLRVGYSVSLQGYEIS